jgi:hypothetical protein
MSRVHDCDQRDCPAIALHHVEIHGQDFHFCGHHWAELSPALLAHLDQWEATAASGPADPLPPSPFTGAQPEHAGRHR